jgi:hypothetical protein
MALKVNAAHLEAIYRDLAGAALPPARCDCGDPLFSYVCYPARDRTEVLCALRGLTANPAAAIAPAYLFTWRDLGTSPGQQSLIAGGALPLDTWCELWSLQELARAGDGPFTDMLALVQRQTEHDHA